MSWKSTKKHNSFEVFIYNSKEETPRPPRVSYANFDLFLMDTWGMAKKVKSSREATNKKSSFISGLSTKAFSPL